MKVIATRNPQKNVEAARALIEMAADPTPLSIAYSDQMAAFHDEMTPKMRAMAEGAGANFADVKITPETLAWELAIIRAVPARGRYACSHRAHGIQPHEVIWTDLSLGIVACEGCYAAGTSMLFQLNGGEMPDDGRCDVCDEETSVFTPFAAQVGLWMVTGHQCDGCAAYSTERAG